jgi:hypothetical protein
MNKVTLIKEAQSSFLAPSTQCHVKRQQKVTTFEAKNKPSADTQPVAPLSWIPELWVKSLLFFSYTVQGVFL